MSEYSQDINSVEAFSEDKVDYVSDIKTSCEKKFTVKYENDSETFDEIPLNNLQSKNAEEVDFEAHVKVENIMHDEIEIKDEPDQQESELNTVTNLEIDSAEAQIRSGYKSKHSFECNI